MRIDCDAHEIRIKNSRAEPRTILGYLRRKVSIGREFRAFYGRGAALQIVPLAADLCARKSVQTTDRSFAKRFEHSYEEYDHSGCSRSSII